MTHLTRTELAERWGLHPGTLANWTVWGRGPEAIRAGRRVLYRLSDIEAYENANDIAGRCR